MKIAFIYKAPFHPISAFQRPVSEAEAAVIYLAIELAKIGHNITLFSDTANNIGAFNIRCRSISIKNKALNIDKAILEPNYDAIIVKNAPPEFLISLRHAIPNQANMYLWTSKGVDDPINLGLYDEKEIAELKGIACVSNWQREHMIAKMPIPHNKIVSIQYAISPMFENLFISGKELYKCKSKTPSLVYTATSLAGLEVLLATHNDVVVNYPDATLTLYSGMHAYGKEDHKIENIYESAKALKGLNQIGSISNIELAAALRDKTIMTYPGINASNYNIDILEAMAAGLYVLTSDAGALPEYGHGLSKTVPVEDLAAEHLDGFVSQTLTICQTQVHSTEAFFDYCFKQTQVINEKHTWRVRAREWIAFLNAEN